jgi:DNA-binding transcriptional MerR regulator
MTSWTLTELAARASEALAAEPGRVNGRVQEVPNERLIRWYTTIGLVDPPLSRRGRIALYGPRHLLQIVAVKRRQAAGLTIAEIQAELAGAPDTVLQQISGLHGQPPAVEPPTRNRFWATAQSASGAVDPASQTPEQQEGVSAPRVGETGPRPEPAASQSDLAFPPEGEVELAPGLYSHPGSPNDHAAGFSPGHADAFAIQGLRLADGVTLLLEGTTFTADDLTALAAAAQPLLDEITSRRTAPRRSS